MRTEILKRLAFHVEPQRVRYTRRGRILTSESMRALPEITSCAWLFASVTADGRRSRRAAAYDERERQF